MLVPVPNPQSNDQQFKFEVSRAIAALASNKLGESASPTFGGLTVSGTTTLSSLTASRLVQTNVSKALASVSDLTSWIGGTSGILSATDNGDGTITLNISDLSDPSADRIPFWDETDNKIKWASVIGNGLTLSGTTLYWAWLNMESLSETPADDSMMVYENVSGGMTWESGSTLRTTLGLAIGSDVQAWDDDLDDIAALTPTDGNFMVGDGSDWITESGNTARTSLGLGTGDTPQFTRLGIGAAASSGFGVRNIFNTSNTAVATEYAVYSQMVCEPAANSGTYFRGGQFEVETKSANNFTGYVQGTLYLVEHEGTGTLAQQIGLDIRPQNSSTGTVSDQRALNISSSNEAAGGTVSQYYGIYHNYSNVGTLTASYFIYDLSDMDSYFSGKCGFGDSNPQEDVHANDTVRADVAFNLNGTDIITSALASFADVHTSTGGANLAGSYTAIRPTNSTDLVEAIRLGRYGNDIRYHSIYQKCGSTTNSYLEFRIHDGGGSPYTGQTTLLRLEGSTPEVKILGHTHIDTATDLGTEALKIQQDDDDQAFIDFDGTSAADSSKNISTQNGDGSVEGPKNYSAANGWAFEGMVKVEVNGAARWMPYYSEDTA